MKRKGRKKKTSPFVGFRPWKTIRGLKQKCHLSEGPLGEERGRETLLLPYGFVHSTGSWFSCYTWVAQVPLCHAMKLRELLQKLSVGSAIPNGLLGTGGMFPAMAVCAWKAEGSPSATSCGFGKLPLLSS